MERVDLPEELELLEEIEYEDELPVFKSFNRSNRDFFSVETED